MASLKDFGLDEEWTDPYDPTTAQNHFGFTNPAPPQALDTGQSNTGPAAAYDPATGGYTGPTTTTPTGDTFKKAPVSSGPQDVISQFEGANPASGGLDRLLTDLVNSGANAKPYLYGTTPSNNEILLNGQKTKVISENGGNPANYTWYNGENDSGPVTTGSGGGGAATGFTGLGGAAGAGNAVHDNLSQFLMGLLSQLSGRQDPNAAFRSSLLSRFNTLADQYGRPVDPNDPIISANAQAYHGAQARNLAQYQEMAAERAHAEGVPTGAFDSAIGNATQAAGRDEAQYTGGLMNSEQQSRRAALINILQQSGTYLSDQDKLALQDKIASIDATLGLNSQNNQLALGEGALANQSTGLTNQNTQFYDKLAADIGGQNNSLDSILTDLLLRK